MPSARLTPITQLLRTQKADYHWPLYWVGPVTPEPSRMQLCLYRPVESYVRPISYALTASMPLPPLNRARAQVRMWWTCRVPPSGPVARQHKGLQHHLVCSTACLLYTHPSLYLFALAFLTAALILARVSGCRSYFSPARIYTVAIKSFYRYLVYFGGPVRYRPGVQYAST